MIKKLLLLIFATVILSSIAYAQVPTPDAHYTFDDTDLSGSTVTDSTSNQDGYLGGTVTTGHTGKLGEAFYFDGSACVDLHDVAHWDVNNNVTICMWIFANSSLADGTDAAVFAQDGHSNNVYKMAVYGGSSPAHEARTWIYINPAYPVAQEADNAGTISQDDWNYYCFVYNRINISVYVNGTLAATQAETDPIVPAAGNNSIGSTACQSGYYTGFIDEVTFWKKSLTPLQIRQTLWNEGNGCVYPFTSCNASATTSLDLTLTDQWNGSSILEFFTEISWGNGTTTNHSTTNGTVALRNISESNLIVNVTYHSMTTYFNVSIQSVAVTANTTNTITNNTYQAVACFNATEWISNNTINLANITTGSNITTQCFNISEGSHNFLFQTDNHNNRNQTFNITALSNQTYTATNFSGGNITIFAQNGATGANLSSYTINITSLNYTNWPGIHETGVTNKSYNLTNGTYNILVSLTEFSDNETGMNITYNSSQQNITFILYPIRLHLIFTETVEGYIATTSGGEYFNASEVLLDLTNYSIGYVDVYFNKDANENFLQYYAYYNANNTYVADNIYVETPDLHQQIKVFSGGSEVEAVRVCSHRLVNTSGNISSWYVTFCDYTDSDGIADMMLNDQNEYLITVQGVGYVAANELHYIPESNTETIVITITSTDDQSGRNLITTNYQPIFFAETDWIVGVTTYLPSATIQIVHNETGAPVTTTFTSSTTGSVSIPITNGTNPISVSILIDGETIKTFLAFWGEENANVTVDWFNQTNLTNTRTPIYDSIRSDKEYWVLFMVMILIASALSGLIVERYFVGQGIYGVAGFVFIIASTGFWELYLVGLPVFIYAGFTLIRPLIGGKET